MFDPKNIILIRIGSTNKIFEYYTGIDIINNYSFAEDLQNVTIFNGDLTKICSGIFENTFISMPINQNPASGALEEINCGLGYAKAGYRDIIVIHNFDVHFLTEQGFVKAVDNFIDSGKQFSAGVDCNELVAPDCMIFRKEFLKQILPFEFKVCDFRLQQQNLVEKYKPTSLGFENTEEYILYTLVNKCIQPELDHIKKLNKEVLDSRIEYSVLEFNKKVNEKLLEYYWHDMQRVELPRLEWTPEITLLHTHNMEYKKQLLKQYNITKGQILEQFVK